MKLKSFEKVRVATVTEYVVFHNRDYVESFEVDYLAKTADGEYDNAKTTAGILKRIKYEDAGAKVLHVSVNSATGNLKVSIEI